MLKVAFVQNFAFEYLGITTLAGVLKAYGHRVEVFIGNNIRKIAGEVKDYGADLAGFSCVTGQHKWCLEAAKFIKETMPVVTVFGGPHPTFFPEIINEPQVDIVCRGEGEFSLLELANKLDARTDFSETPNLWVKRKSQIIKNDLSHLIDDLDGLPFADRGIYYQKYRFLNKSQKTFMAGRGCPFRCSYCFNESLQGLYQNKGRYVRLRSVENVLREIKQVRERHGLNTVYMIDDTFIFDLSWASEFLERYALEIKLPLICLARADLFNEKIAQKLKKANCYSVFFGVESGNENLRNVVLGKRLTDEQVIKTSSLLKKYRIKFRTYNMLGIPGETLGDAFQTVKINIQIKTDYPWCSILQPYPGTRIEEYARNNGLLCGGKIIPESFFRESIMALKDKRELLNLQKLFFFAVKFPVLLPLIKLLIKIRPNPIFDLLFIVGYAYSYRRSENLRFWEFMNIGLRNLKPLLN